MQWFTLIIYVNKNERGENLIEFLKTIAIAAIPAIISGCVSFFVSQKKAKTQIELAKENNKHEIDRLMEQHKVDIESLKEKYRLEAEEREREHNRKLELMQKECEYKLKQQDNEAQNAVTASLMKDMFGISDLFSDSSKK